MKLFSTSELEQQESKEVKDVPISFAVTETIKREEIRIKEELKSLGFSRGFYSDKLFEITKQLHSELQEFIELKKRSQT